MFKTETKCCLIFHLLLCLCGLTKLVTETKQGNKTTYNHQKLVSECESELLTY